MAEQPVPLKGMEQVDAEGAVFTCVLRAAIYEHHEVQVASSGPIGRKRHSPSMKSVIGVCTSWVSELLSEIIRILKNFKKNPQCLISLQIIYFFCMLLSYIENFERVCMRLSF